MKKTIKWGLISLLTLIIMFISFRLLTDKLNDINANKYKKIVNEVSKDKEAMVFIEINPKLVLTTKDNIVIDVACLNNDCASIIDELDVKGKTIAQAVSASYNLAYEKGYNTENGVKVYSKYKLDDKKFNEYIHVEYITEEEEKELVKEVIDKEKVEAIKNTIYEKELLRQLKTDRDYDSVYTCTMEEKLECHIILETGINDDTEYNTDDYEKYGFIDSLIYGSANRVMSTLKKFGFDIKNNTLTFNGVTYSYIPLFTHNGQKYKNVLVGELIDNLDTKYCENGYLEYDKNGKCTNSDGVLLVELSKLNITKGVITKDDILELRLGSTKVMMDRYNAMNIFENDEIKWNERAKRCINKAYAEGYTLEESLCDSCDPYGQNTTYSKKYYIGDNEYKSYSELYYLINDTIKCE